MRLVKCLFVFSVLAATALPASAGWDNVFQPTLFERFRRPATVNYYYVPPVTVAQSAPPVVAHSSPCDPCAPSPCTTKMVMSFYYQPVTVYQNKTVMEPVTTMRTSYYYEPVTTVRYSSYYDPTTCNYTQVAVPQTTLELRAKQCPVQSWVQRCVQEPVTVQEKRYYWTPQTTCCKTTFGAPIFETGAPPQMPMAPSMREADKPLIDKSITPTQPDDPAKRYYPKIENNSGGWRQPQLGIPLPVQTNFPKETAPKMDRIAVGPNSQVEGQVTRSDASPKANAKLLFVNASTSQRRTVIANPAGRFNVELPTGSWHVYLHGENDQPIYHSRVDVSGSQFRQVNLVSRSN